MGRARVACSQKPDSSHTGTASSTIRVRRARWNAMKPRIQCVLTQWKPRFIASGWRLRPAGVRQQTDGFYLGDTTDVVA